MYVFTETYPKNPHQTRGKEHGKRNRSVLSGATEIRGGLSGPIRLLPCLAKVCCLQSLSQLDRQKSIKLDKKMGDDEEIKTKGV